MISFSEIPGLENLDSRSAAGVLSRMALDIQSHGMNPAAKPAIDDEKERRRRLVRFVRSKVADKDDEILDWVDNLADEVSEPIDKDGAIHRLNSDAAIESDAFSVKFEENGVFSELFTEEERAYSRRAVKDPDYSEEFGPEFNPSLVSLYGKWFADGANDFFLIVVGNRRDDLSFEVSYSFRLYPQLVRTFPMGALSDLIERFAHVYGTVFTLGPFRGVFLKNISFVSDPKNVKFAIVLPSKRPGTHFASALMKAEGNVIHASFGLSMNIDQYRKDLSRYNR